MSSYRQSPPNELFLDQFSIYDEDGYTKKSGLVYPTDFSISLWKNCIPDSTTVTIEEIGTSGEYKISFTPTEVGFYELEIHCLWNNEIWSVTIEVRPETCLGNIIEA